MTESDEELDDFLEYMEAVDASTARPVRAPKRYLRDPSNPVGFYTDEDFRKRYRFTKQAVTAVVLPLILTSLTTIDNRGLPVAPLVKLLIFLRFAATGSYQVQLQCKIITVVRLVVYCFYKKCYTYTCLYSLILG